jgi:hypothetical protein
MALTIMAFPPCRAASAIPAAISAMSATKSYWWSASEFNGSDAYDRDMFYSIEGAGWDYNDKSFLFSVRCLQD